MKAIIVESVDPEGPYGAKEAGEGPLHSSVPALSNAIYDALGIRCTRLPFNPPRILGLLRDGNARATWERARSRTGAAQPIEAVRRAEQPPC
jgi:hypothetical protein